MIPTSEQLYHFVDDLEKTLSFSFEIEGEFDDILLCGMGGSAISSDIVSDLCFEHSRIPIRVSKYSEIPRWAGPRTLVICSTYSGNTQESVAAYEGAVAAGCKVIAITAGGLLMDLAERDGTCIIPMPTDMHPRHSIGYMIGYTLAVVQAVSGCDITDSIRECIQSLREYRDEIMPKKTGKAWRMAESLVGRVPLMLSDMSLRSVAFRWKTQFNENAKYIAFTNQSHEFNSCALDVWSADECSNGYLVVLSGSDSPELEDVMARMDERGCQYHVERFDGRSVVENKFMALILGDYISMYMAEIQGIDSGPVPPISRLKELLKERL